MPDFSALMDASTPLFEARAQNRRQTSPVRGHGHPRKKLSISLAAGLMMNTDVPKSGATTFSPVKLSLESMREESLRGIAATTNLFHAYALKVRYLTPSSPNLGLMTMSDLTTERRDQLTPVYPHICLCRHLHAMVGPRSTRVPRCGPAEPAAFCYEGPRSRAHTGELTILQPATQVVLYRAG
jgi:hypothetical protein